MIKPAIIGMCRSGATYSEIESVTGIYILVIKQIIESYLKQKNL